MRACDRCERRVQFCRTPEELAYHVGGGACVAFSRSTLVDAVGVIAESPRTHSAREPKSLCLLEGPEFVDLDAVDPTPEALGAVPAHFASTYRLVPITFEENGTLVVAVADLDHPTRLDDLSFMLAHDVRHVLTTPAPLARALERCYPEPEEDYPMMGELIEEM